MPSLNAMTVPPRSNTIPRSVHGTGEEGKPQTRCCDSLLDSGPGRGRMGRRPAPVQGLRAPRGGADVRTIHAGWTAPLCGRREFLRVGGGLAVAGFLSPRLATAE